MCDRTNHVRPLEGSSRETSEAGGDAVEQELASPAGQRSVVEQLVSDHFRRKTESLRSFGLHDLPLKERQQGHKPVAGVSRLQQPLLLEVVHRDKVRDGEAYGDGVLGEDHMHREALWFEAALYKCFALF